MGGFFSKPIIDTEKDVILTMCPEYYLDNWKEYSSDSRPADTYRWDGSRIESVAYGTPYKITSKDKITKKFYEMYFKKLLKKEHNYLFTDDEDKKRHKKIKLLKISKKQNKIVATYSFGIEGVDLKRETSRVCEGLYKATQSGDKVFFKKINGKKVYIRFNGTTILTQK